MEAQGGGVKQDAQEDEAQKDPEFENDEEDINLSRSMDAVSRRSISVQDRPQRIHIAGTGNIGKLVAWALRGLPDPPPVTLCFHRYDLCQAWERGKQEITIQDGAYPVARSGYEIELQRHVKIHHGVVWDAVHNPDPYNDTRRPHEVAADVQKEQKQGASLAQGVSDGDTAAYTPFTASERIHASTGQVEDTLSTHQGAIPPPAAAEPLDQVPHHGWAKYYSNEPIHHLIITTKAAITINAITAVRHRLTRDSTICFLQNGMGIIDEVNEKIFPNEAERPSYIQGVVTHGVNVPREAARINPFFAVHAGRGSIALGILPSDRFQTLRPSPDPDDDPVDPGQRPKADVYWTPTARFLLRTLTRSPVLSATGCPPIELLQLQLEKLAVNSIINPLTALIDCRNGLLNSNDGVSRSMRLMLAETSLVITSLPELRSIPGIPIRFSSRRLEQICKSVAEQTCDNISSMLADVRAGYRTEINYINGYIVKRGDELGIKCVVNYAMMQTVLAKQQVVSRELMDKVPVEKSPVGALY